jgi:hypothetical protein
MAGDSRLRLAVLIAVLVAVSIPAGRPSTVGAVPAAARVQVAPLPQAFVHIDAGRSLASVPPVVGSAVAWAQADQTADHTHDGHLYPPAVRQLAAMNLAYLRFPSGEFSNCFDWTRSVGAIAGRKPMLINWDPTSNNHPCYGSDVDVFGTDEFMNEIAQLSALEGRHVEPVITVNVCSLTLGVGCGSGDYPSLCPNPQDVAGGGCPGAVSAAQWVGYLNGAASTQFGAQRAANGHAAPYGVRYFELGNETPIAQTPDRPYYAALISAYAQAMRAVDPGIRIIAQVDCGCSNTYDPVRASSLLAQAGHDIDLLAPHLYIEDGDLSGTVSRYLEGIQGAVDAAGYHDRIGIFPTEWAAHDETAGLPQTTRFADMTAVLANASEIQAFITHGVQGSDYFSVDGGPFHLIHCSHTDPLDSNTNDPCADPAHPPYLSLTGQLMKLLAPSIDAWGLHTSSSPELHATATAGNGTVHVQLVNNTDRELTTLISYGGMQLSWQGSLQYLSGPRLTEVLRGPNTPAGVAAAEIGTVSALLTWEGMIVTIPPRSVSVLTGHLSWAQQATLTTR